MGHEASTPVEEEASVRTIESNTIDAIGKMIKEGSAKKVVVMTGAGISTSAGIPDFRSPKTGLYANLARLNLPYAQAVFDISYFRTNPLPFYTLAHELYPGKYRPTITHCFIALLHKKNILLKLFTQNIDCLEREAGVPDNAICEAHGSFAKQRCIECSTEYPDDKMLEAVKKKEVPRCLTANCNGLVKPDIVFFGEGLPALFFQDRLLLPEADLAIVMGTSLTVHPFAGLPELVPKNTPRLLINLEKVGSFGSRLNDVLLLGDCDDGVRQLAAACGWLEELEDMWEKNEPVSGNGMVTRKEPEEPKSMDDRVGDEVDKLTKAIDESLKISKEHAEQETDRLTAEKRNADANIAVGNEGKHSSPSSGEARAEGNVGLRHVFPHLKTSLEP